jgi:hypothetical protein
LAWGVLITWLLIIVTGSQIVMAMLDCSQKTYAYLGELGVEHPIRWMVTCDIEGKPDMSPYSLPENPPPFELPQPLCPPTCQRAPFFPQLYNNLFVPFYATRHYFWIGQRIVWKLYREGSELIRHITA